MLLACFLEACTHSAAPPASGSDAGPHWMAVEPSSIRLPAGDGTTFTAVIDGSSGAAVHWSIVEGAAGGDVTDEGQYTAPDIAGTYHLVASSKAGPARSAAATIVVLADDDPGSPTSDQLIARALSRGELDAEAALEYRVFAAFGDDRLPDAYRGDDSDVVDDAALLDVVQRFDGLSAQARDVLQPFLLPPYDDASWLALRPVERSSRDLGAPPGHFLDEWDSFEWPDGIVRVWWLRKNEPGDKARAMNIAAAVDIVIAPKLDALGFRRPLPDGGHVTAGITIAGGDDRLDILLTDHIRYSITVPYDGCKQTPAYIELAHGANDAIVAHEYMHAVQFAYHPAAACDDEAQRWLREATATWAEDWIFPFVQDEHRFARYLLDVPELPLEKFDELPGDPSDPIVPIAKAHQYGGYLFPYYLAQASDPNLIRKIWSATTGTTSVLQAIDDSIPGGFKRVWPAFTRFNWNRKDTAWGKYREFRSQNPLGDHLQRTATPVKDFAPRLVALSGLDDQIRLEAPVEHLAARYYHFKFPDTDGPDGGPPRSVLFYNGQTFKLSEQEDLVDFQKTYRHLVTDGVPEAAKRGASIWALFKIAGEQAWREPEEWTGKETRFFCRDRKSERIEELVLVVSNSAFDDPYRLKPPDEPPLLFFSKVGCWRWKALTQVKYDSGPGGFRTTVSASNVLFAHPDVPDLDEAQDGRLQFFPVGGQIDWEIEGTLAVDDGTFCTLTGNGHRTIGADRASNNYLETANFVLPGAAWFHAYAGAGSTGGFTETDICPAGLVTSEAVAEWFNPSFHSFDRRDIEADGTIRFSNVLSESGVTISEAYALDPCSEGDPVCCLPGDSGCP